MKKTVSVHMLLTDNENPTQVRFLQMNQSGRLVAHAAGGEFRKYLQLGFKPQHLYLTNDEEIKEGDWYIFAKELHKAIASTVKIANIDLRLGNPYNKVMATTNPELNFYESETTMTPWLPTIAKIPDSFIQSYIKAYNEEKPIKEVILEYEEKVKNVEGTTRIFVTDYIRPKLNVDGSVIWSLKEEKMYSADTIKEIISDVLWELSVKDFENMTTQEQVANYANKWFDRNYL